MGSWVVSATLHPFKLNCRSNLLQLNHVALVASYHQQACGGILVGLVTKWPSCIKTVVEHGIILCVSKCRHLLVVGF